MESHAAIHSDAGPDKSHDVDGGHYTACPVVLDEVLPLSGAQPVHIVDAGKYAQHLAPPSEPAPLSRVAHERDGGYSLPNSPGPPDRAYLRSRRLLI